MIIINSGSARTYISCAYLFVTINYFALELSCIPQGAANNLQSSNPTDAKELSFEAKGMGDWTPEMKESLKTCNDDLTLKCAPQIPPADGDSRKLFVGLVDCFLKRRECQRDIAVKGGKAIPEGTKFLLGIAEANAKKAKETKVWQGASEIAPESAKAKQECFKGCEDQIKKCVSGVKETDPKTNLIKRIECAQEGQFQCMAKCVNEKEQEDYVTAASRLTLLRSVMELPAQKCSPTAGPNCISDLTVTSMVPAIVGANEQINQSSDFCTKSGLPGADGTQIRSGFCSSTVMGAIPAVERMVSTLIIEPKNAGIVAAKTNFTVKIRTKNMKLGFFNQPKTQYYLTPQTLSPEGFIQGHQHIVIQKLKTDETIPLDAAKFDFFKGLDQAPENGPPGTFDLQTTVPGLEPSEYRLCTITGSASHQPVVMPVAQRGHQDDCIRFTVQ